MWRVGETARRLAASSVDIREGLLMQAGGTGRGLNSLRKEYQIIKYYPWARHLLNVVNTRMKLLSFIEMGDFIECLRDLCSYSSLFFFRLWFIGNPLFTSDSFNIWVHHFVPVVFLCSAWNITSIT
jgi:hypothetical protein